jgi:hypothetical protein
MIGAYTGPDLTGKCPNFDALDAASVSYDTSKFTGLLALCYQKYVGDGLAVSDYAPGNIDTWKQMVSGSGGGASPTDVQISKQIVQGNPSSLSVPQPGTTPVNPGTGLFAQIFSTLVQGATPLASAAIQLEMNKAIANKQPIHVPTPIVKQAAGGGGMSSQTKSILWLAAGAVALTVVLALVLRKK